MKVLRKGKKLSSREEELQKYNKGDSHGRKKIGLPEKGKRVLLKKAIEKSI